jgi:hypothetical protein
LKLFIGPRVALLRCHDQHDGSDDRGTRDDRRPSDRLAEKERAEGDRDHGIDEGVRGDDRDPHVLQQPCVRGKGDQRADQYEVGERDQRLRGERACVDVVCLARRQARDPEEEGCCEHLHRCRLERAARQGRAARVERAGRPGRRGRDEDERDADVVASAGSHEQRDAGETDHEPGDCGRGQATAEEEAVEERDVERDDRDDQRGEAGVEPCLRPGDAAVADEQERRADDRRGKPFTPGGTRTPTCRERI